MQNGDGHGSGWCDLAESIWADRFSAGIEGVDGLEGELVIGLGCAGGQRNSAQVVPAFHCSRGAAKFIQRLTRGTVEAVNAISGVANKELPTHCRRRIAHVGFVGPGNQRTRNNVDSLHSQFGTEAKGALDGDCRSGSYKLSGEIRKIRSGYWVEAIERGDVISARRNCAGHAWVSVRIAQFFHWVHQGPSEQPIGGSIAGKHLVVGLGPIEPKYASKAA